MHFCRRFEPLLPRAESSEVDELREKWEELCNLASKVQHCLQDQLRLVLVNHSLIL